MPAIYLILGLLFTETGFYFCFLINRGSEDEQLVISYISNSDVKFSNNLGVLLPQWYSEIKQHLIIAGKVGGREDRSNLFQELLLLSAGRSESSPGLLLPSSVFVWLQDSLLSSWLPTSPCLAVPVSYCLNSKQPWGRECLKKSEVIYPQIFQRRWLFCSNDNFELFSFSYAVTHDK